MTSNLFSILISSLVLVQSFNIHIGDVLKLNELIDHAEFHQEKYGDDFMVFFSKHYGNLKDSHKKQRKEEEKDHSHPPINHDCGSQLQVSYVMHKISFSFEKIIVVERSANFCYQDKFSNFEKQKIFQPPKLA